MSNTKQILAMLRSRAEGDEDAFYSIALQVAAAEARQGRAGGRPQRDGPQDGSQIRASGEAAQRANGTAGMAHAQEPVLGGGLVVYKAKLHESPALEAKTLFDMLQEARPGCTARVSFGRCNVR